MGLLIRFQRVQVQLRAQEENTVKILSSIKRASILEVVFILTLTFSQICYVLGDYGTELFDFSSEAAQTLLIIGYIFDMAFVCVLSLMMKSVNKQLALFFDQVGIKAYPTKSIASLIAVFVVIAIQQDIVIVSSYYIKINKIYNYLQGWTNLIVYRAIYLTLTVAFYYLADFGFEARTNPVRFADHQEGFSTNLNQSKATNPAEMSLLGVKKQDSNQMPGEVNLNVDQFTEQVAEKAKSVKNFNWAWQFRSDDTEEWQQFDCTDCLQLEFNYQVFKLSNLKGYSKVQLLLGVVDMENFTLKHHQKLKCMVRRTENNTRNRNNAAKRHDPVQYIASRNSEMHFISDTHLEWTSLNYRKEKAAALSPSRRRMVLMMYQKLYPYFPTLREIRDELIDGQNYHI